MTEDTVTVEFTLSDCAMLALALATLVEFERNEKVIKAAQKLGIKVADAIGEQRDIPADARAAHEEAKARGVVMRAAPRSRLEPHDLS